MKQKSSRREFLAQAGAALAVGAAGKAFAADGAKPMKRTYEVSLAAWSLHKTIGKREGQVPMLDMPKLSREKWDIGGIELVNNMLASSEKPYLDEFAKNAAAHNVKILLIMIDGQGDAGAADQERRDLCVKNHCRWIDIAADFGCHSIRMNWGGAPKTVHEDAKELKDFTDRSVPTFRAICDHGDKKNINVLIENHWGASSYIGPLTGLMKAVDHPRFGILPDFGNFPDDVDKYEAVDAFMPWAKALSAKCYDFDDATGLETKIDFEKMLQIAVDKHGYNQWIGIEYEGNRLSEYDGIAAANKLLLTLRG